MSALTKVLLVQGLESNDAAKVSIRCHIVKFRYYLQYTLFGHVQLSCLFAGFAARSTNLDWRLCIDCPCQLENQVAAPHACTAGRCTFLWLTHNLGGLLTC